MKVKLYKKLLTKLSFGVIIKSSKDNKTNKKKGFDTMMKHIDCEQPQMQQVFGQAVWNSEKGMWEVALTLTEIVHTITKNYLTIQRNFEVDVKACDEFVLPTAIIQANGFKAEEIIKGSVIANTKRDGIETES